MKKPIDPLLAHLLGDAGDEAPISDDGSDSDPVGDFIFRQRYGIDRPGSVPGLRSVEEIGKALDSLRADLATAPSEAQQAFYRKMAAAAELYAPGTFAEEFLKGAAENDDGRMRCAVKSLVAQHKEEIIVADGSLEKLLVIE
jgi:hypothetical protein